MDLRKYSTIVEAIAAVVILVDRAITGSAGAIQALRREATTIATALPTEPGGHGGFSGRAAGRVTGVKIQQRRGDVIWWTAIITRTDNTITAYVGTFSRSEDGSWQAVEARPVEWTQRSAEEITRDAQARQRTEGQRADSRREAEAEEATSRALIRRIIELIEGE